MDGVLDVEDRCAAGASGGGNGGGGGGRRPGRSGRSYLDRLVVI